MVKRIMAIGNNNEKSKGLSDEEQSRSNKVVKRLKPFKKSLSHDNKTGSKKFNFKFISLVILFALDIINTNWNCVWYKYRELFKCRNS